MRCVHDLYVVDVEISDCIVLLALCNFFNQTNSSADLVMNLCVIVAIFNT